jgi:hypothetical protein
MDAFLWQIKELPGRLRACRALGTHRRTTSANEMSHLAQLFLDTCRGTPPRAFGTAIGPGTPCGGDGGMREGL